jgi:hypothetical protein
MRILSSLFLAAILFSAGCGGEAATAGVGTAQAEETGTDGGGDLGGGVKDAAITGSGGNVAVDAGFAGNGTVIQVPAGFTAAQCKFTAAAATIDGNAISTQVSINHETGEVICEKVVQERTEIPPEVKDCAASYTIICVK